MQIARHGTQQRRKPSVFHKLQFLPIASVGDGDQNWVFGAGGEEEEAADVEGWLVREVGGRGWQWVAWVAVGCGRVGMVWLGGLYGL